MNRIAYEKIRDVAMQDATVCCHVKAEFCHKVDYEAMLEQLVLALAEQKKKLNEQIVKLKEEACQSAL